MVIGSDEELEELERIHLQLAINESVAHDTKAFEDDANSAQQIALLTDDNIPRKNSHTTITHNGSSGTTEKCNSADDKLDHCSGSSDLASLRPSSGSSSAIGGFFGGFRVPNFRSSSLVCAGCNKSCISGATVSALNRTYHHNCFRCSGCNEVITSQFTPHGDPPLPYHAQCAVELFNPKCCLCRDSISARYFQHPFFEGEIYCVEHESSPSCFSCGRKEPTAGPKKGSFSGLSDGRSLCFDCASTVIMESSEASAIYARIVDFMETYLELAIPRGMREVPVLAVDLPALNEHKLGAAQGDPYCRGNESTVRGLTMSTCGEVRHMSRASARFDRASGTFRMSAASPAVLRIEEVRDVTAVLVLYGLPEELTSSILAHEAMHVYMKLSRDVPFHLPAKLEEGLCQVVAARYLQEIGHHMAVGTSNALSEADFDTWQQQAQLRAYLSHQIATDPSEAYGDGYREAVRCVDALGLQVVVDCVKDTKSLPVV